MLEFIPDRVYDVNADAIKTIEDVRLLFKVLMMSVKVNSINHESHETPEWIDAIAKLDMSGVLVERNYKADH